MALWQNIPLFLIVLPLMGAVVCSVLRGGAARALMTCLSVLCCLGMGALLFFTKSLEMSYVYPMGEIGAPFGNELRAGPVEALMGLTFSLVMLFSILGGWQRLTEDIAPNRMNLYGVMICLLLSSMSALTFTNDLFTAYVFVEITTIAASALIAASNRGTTLLASTRYLIMNLLGSGLFLFGLSMLYCLTGHLLFPQLGEGVRGLMESGKYSVPLYLSFVLMTLGVGFKSALYPFHTWLPGAYANASPTSSALLSSLISKAYIFLLIKIMLRAAGASVFAQRIEDVLFLFSALGMIMGSVHAIRQHHFSRMIAYSSVSQIGYIFMGISLGTQAGMAAALFHILAHSAAKAMLFLSANKLREASGGSDSFRDLRGAALRSPLAGTAFSVGAASLVGIPMLGGFASKVYLAQVGVALGGWRMAALLAVLCISTALNAAYLMRTVLILYRSGERDSYFWKIRDNAFAFTAAAMIAINVLLGVFGGRIMNVIQAGLRIFT